MAPTTCRVTYRDDTNTTHTVTVSATSLYEAVALAVKAFERDPLIHYQQHPHARTQLRVEVQPPTVLHEVRWGTVLDWVNADATEAPAAVARRKKVRAILGTEPSAARAHGAASKPDAPPTRPRPAR